MSTAPAHNPGHRLRPYHGQNLTEAQQIRVDALSARHGEQGISCCLDCDYVEIAHGDSSAGFFGQDKMLHQGTGKVK